MVRIHCTQQLESKAMRKHYNDVIMSAFVSEITRLTIVYSTVYSKCRSKKTTKLRVTGICARNSMVTVEFPAQMASYAENVSIRWRHHEPCTWFLGCTIHSPLTHCDQNDVANISKLLFGMSIVAFTLKFHWNLPAVFLVDNKHLSQCWSEFMTHLYVQLKS